MNTRPCLAILCAFVAFFSIAAAANSAEASDTGPAAAKPPVALYIFAPSAASAAKTNLVGPETALRCVAIELAARGLYVVYVPADQLTSAKAASYPRLELQWVDAKGAAAWKAAFRRSATESVELCNCAFDWADWGRLTLSSANARDKLLTALGGCMSLPPRGVPARLDDGDKKALDGAFDKLCAEGPPAALDAAKAIDGVLSAHPSSAEALRAACWPSAMLATQDLHGTFQLRDRLLSVPLSWWLSAEKAALATDARGRLTGAWVALVCGFPRESLAVVNALGEDGSKLPLARALAMFATRDYRPLDGKAEGAPAIEQLAWIWAIQECTVFGRGVETSYKIMTTRRSVAFGPLYGVPSVSAGHAFSAVMCAGACIGLIEDVTAMPGVHEDEREALAAEIEAFAKSHKGGRDEMELWSGMPLAAGMRFTNKAAALALRSPDGPVRRAAEGVTWQCVSPWAYGQVGAGLAYQAAQLCADFYAHSWGVPETADAFLKGVLAGFDDDCAAAFFFQGAQKILGDGWAGSAVFQKSLTTEAGAKPAQWRVLAEWGGDDWMDCVRDRTKAVHYPCGAWDLQMCFEAGAQWTPTDKRRNWYKRAIQVDEYNAMRALTGVYESSEPKALTAVVDRMPYHSYMIYCAAWSASHAKKYDAAIALYRRVIAVDPSYSQCYQSLAETYEAMGDRPAAIRTLKESLDGAPESVCASYAQAQLADLLLADGKTDEALSWAEKSSRTYAGVGLIAYAKALCAAGRTDEGLDYYLKAAERYASHSFDYLVQLSIHGAPSEKVVAEARRLARMHEGRQADGSIASALLVRGCLGAAKELVSGSSDFSEQSLREYWLGLISLLEGDYPVAAWHFRTSRDKAYFVRYHSHEYAALEAYIAAVLADNPELKYIMQDYFASHADLEGDEGIGIAYLQHKLTREDALARTSDDYTTIELCWLFGAEAEASDDKDAAANYYRKAAENKLADTMAGGRFARQRLKALGIRIDSSGK